MHRESQRPRAETGRVYPVDYCLADYAGFGACVLRPNHPQRHRDANGHEFGLPVPAIARLTMADIDGPWLSDVDCPLCGRAVAWHDWIDVWVVDGEPVRCKMP